LQAEAFANLDTLRGTLSMRSPRIVAAGYAAGPIDAVARIDGRRVGLDARAAAYGASATALGAITLPDFAKKGGARPIAFDLHGQARRVDLRRLPRELKAPPAVTDVNADYKVAGTVDANAPSAARVTGRARFQPSTVAGAAIAGGSVVGVAMN